MKGTMIDVISAENELILFKCNRGWKRPLRVTLHERPKTRTISFPKEKDWLRIYGVHSYRKCILKVGAAGLKRIVDNGDYHVASPPKNRKALISGSGRCGTQAVSQYLNGLQGDGGVSVESRHESLHEYILPMLLAGDKAGISGLLKGMQHEIESAPYYALCPEVIRADLVIHLIRDGRRVVQSGINRGWYDNTSLWNMIKPVFSLDRFENCCHLWRLTTENMANHAQHTFRLEDLIASANERKRLTDVIGLASSNKPIPHVNQGRSSSGYEQWSSRQIQQFTDICGAVMDRYYPGWEDQWRKASSKD